MEDISELDWMIEIISAEMNWTSLFPAIKPAQGAFETD